jgi:hypothetical protein
MGANITAWTGSSDVGLTAPFVSINEDFEGYVSFTVRSDDGDLVCVGVPDHEFGRMVREMFAARGANIGMNGGPPLEQ